MANERKDAIIKKVLPLTKDESEWIDKFAKKTFRSKADVMRLAIATLRNVTDDTYEHEFITKEDVEYLTNNKPDMLERKGSG